MSMHFLLDLTQVKEFTRETLDEVIRTQLGIPTASTHLDLRVMQDHDIPEWWLKDLLGAYRRYHAIPARILHSNNDQLHQLLMHIIIEYSWGSQVMDTRQSRELHVTGNRIRPAIYG